MGYTYLTAKGIRKFLRIIMGYTNLTAKAIRKFLVKFLRIKM